MKRGVVVRGEVKRRTKRRDVGIEEEKRKKESRP